jgi:hypothetical protein
VHIVALTQISQHCSHGFFDFGFLGEQRFERFELGVVRGCAG